MPPVDLLVVQARNDDTESIVNNGISQFRCIPLLVLRMFVAYGK